MKYMALVLAGAWCAVFIFGFGLFAAREDAQRQVPNRYHKEDRLPIKTSPIKRSVYV